MSCQHKADLHRIQLKTWDWDDTRGGPERGLPGRGDGDWENSADWGRDLRSSEIGLICKKSIGLVISKRRRLFLTCESALSLQGRLTLPTATATIVVTTSLVQRISWGTSTWLPAPIIVMVHILITWAPRVWITVSFVTGAITGPWAAVVTVVWIIISFMFITQFTRGFTQIRVTGWRFWGLSWHWPAVLVSILSRPHLVSRSDLRVSLKESDLRYQVVTYSRQLLVFSVLLINLKQQHWLMKKDKLVKYRSLQTCCLHLCLLQQGRQFCNLCILWKARLSWPWSQISIQPGLWRCCQSPCLLPQVFLLRGLSADRIAESFMRIDKRFKQIIIRVLLKDPMVW